MQSTGLEASLFYLKEFSHVISFKKIIILLILFRIVGKKRKMISGPKTNSVIYHLGMHEEKKLIQTSLRNLHSKWFNEHDKRSLYIVVVIISYSLLPCSSPHLT